MNLIEDNSNNITLNSDSSSNIYLSDKFCNICTENVENDKLVTLACNPNHYFCYTCIFDWYNTIKNNVDGFGSFGIFNVHDNKQCTCPICKKDGGILPLLEPHTEPIIGIHVKGLPLLNKEFSNMSICSSKECNSYCHMGTTATSKPNINGIKLHKNFCYIHYDLFQKGKDIILKNDELFESPYLHCDCKMPNNKQCSNMSIYNKVYSITMNNKTYYLCKQHTKLYNHNIELILNDNLIVSKGSTDKSICCFSSKKLTYGYCLHQLDENGLCRTETHNKNKQNIQLENSHIFGDSDNEIIHEMNIQTDAKPKVMNIHIGLCGATLKNGKGTCQNKGKSEFNGKCGIHKNC